MDACVCQAGAVPVPYPSALRDPELFSVCGSINQDVTAQHFRSPWFQTTLLQFPESN